ncbi:acyl-[ACP]--phospholipid O-acyltransferase [Leucothrix arctica]|uniref:Acyl-[ACP]--phospholipid O-acyltransferase n=1 Tax=Leucothrix arctica TaxID=1481894 RepID=A0A317CJ17_9GAMM|nr:acyl-[ACP]--phospholipid O-acyltransferase [Leucothrix arctica]PWQ96320.1 acyl-[ACP]--phospholipid O-acyltransferase [Leucothrix arctica]
MSKLLKVVGAIPFLIAVFLNTVVDLGHKIVIQNTLFKVYDDSYQVYLTAIVNALILLPFILMFSTAGFIADKYPKNKVMRVSAWAAVGLTIAITVCYAMGWFWASFAMTFLLAVQSAIYSPAKFGYIKSLFGKERLAEANGFVQAVAIIGILVGTLIFSILFETWFPAGTTDKGFILRSLVPVGFILIATSIFELVMMYRLPQLDELKADYQFDFKSLTSGAMTRKNLKDALSNKVIFLSIIGLTVFWSIGQVMLAAFPAFLKAETGETNTIVIQAILAMSGVGIAIGSTIAARMSKNYIETGLVPIGAAGVALGLFILPTLSSKVFMGLDFMFIGIMGGIFIVPLNSLIQYHAKENNLGRVLAANNLVQNLGMLFFLLVTVAFAKANIASSQLLLFISAVAVAGFSFTVYKLPQSLVRFILTYFMNMKYKVAVEGMKNIPANGGVLLLGNHVSWIDWAIVQLASPRPVRFVMIRNIYERWYLKWFFQLFGSIPIESGPASSKSLDRVAELLNNGEVVCLFPEGTLSRTGHLGEFKRGYEKAAKLANDDVVIVPFYLRGLWGSQFSRSSEKLRSNQVKGMRRELLVSFGARLSKDTPATILKRRVFDLSISSWKSYSESLQTLPNAWIDTVKSVGGEMALADTMSEPLSAIKAFTASAAFSRKISKLSPEQNIGLLLPTSSGGVIANMAGLLAGKTLVNLNYTSSTQALASAIEQAEIKTVYTSARFIKKLEQRGVDLSTVLEKTHVVYLEELKKEISKLEMVSTLIGTAVLPARVLKWIFCRSNNPKATAAILFSSGSEGAPKGIELSHENIIANLKQVAEVLNADGDDVIMASLPLFHAFGLTATQFLPLVEGLPMVCHADPTDGFGVAKAVAKYRATVMFGTSTFLRLYSRDRKIKPLMFDSLRLVVAGAEKLSPDVREAFKMKFSKDVYEGYGATETAPVASVNLPDALDLNNWNVQLGGKRGTVGMPLPGSSFKIVDPATLEELTAKEDGMILIGGPQVMKGYLNDPEKTSKVIHDIEGVRWYVSGDKGHLDDDGFLVIVDRYSRFAKLGGEMISLSEVEATIQEYLGDEAADVIAMNVPDDKKGEKVVLLDNSGLELKTLRQAMLDKSVNPLLIPAKIIQVETLPKLGSGKTDFVKAKALALSHLES